MDFQRERLGSPAEASAKAGGSRRPGTKSLWLLPSGPDQVGDSAVRRLPAAHMGEPGPSCKFMFGRFNLH